jgi:hypothetical protein
MERRHHSCDDSRIGRRPARLLVTLILLGGLALLLLGFAPLAGAGPRALIFDAFATPSWTATLAGPGPHYDRGADVVTYGKNIVFVAGSQTNAAFDISLTRYRGAVAQWTKTYDGPAHSSDAAFCMALSPDGKAVYIAGSSLNAAGMSDVVVLKRSTKNGRLLWARRYDGRAHLMEEPREIVVDRRGNVTVVGATQRSATDADALAVSWTAKGKRRFIWRRDGGAHTYDFAYDIVANDDGTYIVAGQVGLPGGTQGALTVRLSAKGKVLWLDKYAGPAGTGAMAQSVVARPGGGYYVGGSCTQVATGVDGLVLRYTKRGRRTVFAVDTGAGGTSSQGLMDLAVASTRAVVGVGFSSAGGSSDCHSVAWRANGTLIGAPSIGGPFDDAVYTVATDAFGGYYAVGHAGAAPGDQKIVVLRGSVLTGGGGFVSVWGGPVASIANTATAVAVRDVTAYVVGLYESGGPTGVDQVLLTYIY